MKTSLRLAFAFGLILLPASLLTEPVSAQPDLSRMVPPRRVTDGRGVDLVSGQMRITVPMTAFGENATGLSAWLDYDLSGPIILQPGTFMNLAGGAMASAIRPQAHVMFIDGSGDQWWDYENVVFPSSAGYTQTFSQYPRGNPDQSFTFHINPDSSRYTHSMGTTHMTHFESSDPSLVGYYDSVGTRGVPLSVQPIMGVQLFDHVILPNGEEWRFYREFASVPCTQNCQVTPVTIGRLRFATSSRGYGIQFLYMTDTTPASLMMSGSWNAPRRITGYNKALVYCNESLLQECTAVSALPSGTIAYDSVATTVTMREPGETEGVEVNWTAGTFRHTAVANSTVALQMASDPNGGGYVSRVTDSDGQWNYTHLTEARDDGHIPFMWATSTNPAGGQVQISGFGIFGTIQSLTDELNRSYQYGDGFPFRDGFRMEPELDSTEVARDERNNITSIVRNPKYGSGASPITIYQASYPVHCPNPRTCNRPTSVTDGNNNTTDYTYAPEHGGVLTETGPLVATRQTNGTMANVRPQKRSEYAQRTAWMSNGAGGYVAGPPMWLKVRERYCRTTAASGSTCAGGSADEVMTDYDYGPDSGPNNLLLRGIAATAHDGTQITTLRTCYGYDANGNRISETSPNANLTSCP